MSSVLLVLLAGLALHLPSAGGFQFESFGCGIGLKKVHYKYRKKMGAKWNQGRELNPTTCETVLTVVF